MNTLVKPIIITTLVLAVITFTGFLFLSDSSEKMVTKKEQLIIGIFPRRDIPKTIKMFTPFAEHLQKVTGIPTKIVTTKSFLSFWKNVKNKKYDLIHYNQLHYK